MNEHNALPNAFWELLDSARDGTLDQTQAEQLADMLASDRSAMKAYVDHLGLWTNIRLLTRAEAASERATARVRATLSQDGLFSVAPDAIPTTTIQAIVGSFPSGWVLAYLVASLILGIGLVFATFVPVWHPVEFASRVPSDREQSEAGTRFAGRVSGAVDCKWASGSDPLLVNDFIPLGRKVRLESGFLEISHNRGAKVILHGPCLYEVKSDSGGYLSQGKLMARIEKKEERKTKNEELPDSRSSFLIPHSYFAVRTPTATVTDLGTEFGVEVDKRGVTDVQVFTGTVEVATSVEQDVERRSEIIQAGQCVHVERDSAMATSADPGSFEEHAKRFTRTMPGKVNAGDAYADMVLSMAPIVYYRMDKWPTTDEAGRYVLVDSAPGAHNGVACVDPTFGPPNCRGKFNGALEIHSSTTSEHAFVSKYPKTENGKLSVSAWVRPIRVDPWAAIVANWCHPLSHETAEDGVGQFAFGVNLFRELMVQIRCQDGTMAGVCERGMALPQSQWHHVAFVADGEVLHLYRNGAEVGAVPCRGIDRQPLPECLGIGCTMDKNGVGPRPESAFQWDGRIDEIAIFNHALSAEQVYQLYTGRAAAMTGKTGQ